MGSPLGRRRLRQGFGFSLRSGIPARRRPPAKWSPEGRKQNTAELRRVADKVLRYRELCDRFAN
jgi:hypothetical protein